MADADGVEPARSTALRVCDSLRFYARFIDDMLNFNNVFFQMILNSYPQGITFDLAGTFRPGATQTQGVAYMDAFIYPGNTDEHHMQIKLYDKRRGAGFQKLNILQYTHWESFLPRGTKLNIFVGQFHRFVRLITNERAFHIETALVIVKLTLVCKMPRGALLRSLRRLVFGAATRYVHGNPPHKPGFHLQHILRWVQYGELYGVRALVIQAERVHPRRGHGVCVTELDDTPEEELQQADRRQRLASEAFDQCSTERRAVRLRVASEVSHPQVGILRR
jgi:hypothetical protein